MIELHESILGEFAHQEDARAVGQALQARGWPVTYSDEGTPRWQFESLADYRRFERDFEAVRDELSGAGSLRINWGCDCAEDGFDPCPHGLDPVAEAQGAQRPLEELYGWALRTAMEKHYPGLRGWVERSVDCVYGALAFAYLLEEKTGVTSASGQWLRRQWHLQQHEGGLRTYDRHIDDFASFVHVAGDDAWLSEYLARHKITMDDVQQCRVCGDLIGLGCRCEEK
ncbi:MAG: hypothetical protein ACOC8X_13880 [Chloroflexota bacterium]